MLSLVADGLCLLFPRLSALSVFLAALGISWGVELSQLLHWPWLSSLRQTGVGQLFLGTGFQWLDFPRYAAGALMIFGLDKYADSKN